MRRSTVLSCGTARRRTDSFHGVRTGGRCAEPFDQSLLLDMEDAMMNRLLAASLILAASALNSGERVQGSPQRLKQSAHRLDTATIGASLTRLPMSFEANVGQLDGAVEYMARGEGFRLFLTNTEAVFVDEPRSSKPASPAAAAALISPA